MPPALILLAHGTRDPAGAAEIDRLAGLLGSAEMTVRVGFADVRPPTLADVLAGVPGPAVIVPAFLASGYHVRVDVPEQLAATGRRDVRLADALGPDPALVDVAADRLAAAGWAAGMPVLLGAAGSSDPQAVAEVERAADLLAARIGQPVEIGYATGSPRIGELIGRLPGNAQVAVASWLLAPGMFQRALVSSGANVVADPLGADPRVAAVVRARYGAAGG
jgi:sirohydrochlorin ferrochelatase